MRKRWCRIAREEDSITECVRRDANMFLAHCFVVVPECDLDTSACAISGGLRTLDFQIVVVISFLCISNGFMDLSRQKNV